MAIIYRTGDATQPPLAKGENGYIVHIVNDRGGWGGRGAFVRALSKRWKAPELAYRRWHRVGASEAGAPFTLGEIQTVGVEPNLAVINMLAQHGYSRPGYPAVRYLALEACLNKVAKQAGGVTSVHTIRLGTGLGAGKWEDVEAILERVFIESEIHVYTL